MAQSEGEVVTETEQCIKLNYIIQWYNMPVLHTVIWMNLTLHANQIYTMKIPRASI